MSMFIELLIIMMWMVNDSDGNDQLAYRWRVDHLGTFRFGGGTFTHVVEDYWFRKGLQSSF
jgi:hypothetical protein